MTFQASSALSAVRHCAAISGIAAVLAFAPAAQAVPTVSMASNVAVPLTTQGIYINVVGGVSGPSTTFGWDINPWGTATTTSALNFFNPAAPTGGVYAISVAGQVASLSVGSVVGPGTTYGSGLATTTAASSPWVLNSLNYFGFRLLNEANGLVHYGYGSMLIGSSLQTRTVQNLWFESTPGVAITIAPIPEPSSIALMLMGAAGVAGLVARRRRQTA